MTNGIAPGQRRMALLVAGCTFMELLDGTIVTTSAPRIARSLSTPVSSISLVITAYLVTVATLVPVSGWMSARFGARRVLLSAIALFTLASLGCSLSRDLPELVAMRVLQATGGAMMVPVGRLVVFSQAAKDSLMRVTAYLIWPALIAPVFAPLLGGVITTYGSWHWLFLINLPLGATAIVAASRIIHPPREDPPGRLDTVGVLLTCVGLADLTITCTLLSTPSSHWPVEVAAGVSAVLLIALAATHLLRASNPLIDLRTLRIPTLRFSIMGSAVYFAVIGAGPFLIPLKLEEVFGWSPVKAGAVVLLIFVGNIGIKPATTYLYGRFGFRAMLVFATSVMSTTMIAFAVTTTSTPVVLIGLILLVSGISRSLGGTGYMTIAFVDVPEREMRHAGTVQLTGQQLAVGFGVAGGAIALRIGHHVGGLVSAHSGPASQYRVAFLILAIISLGAMFGATRLHPGAGDVLRGERARGSPAIPAQAP